MKKALLFLTVIAGGLIFFAGCASQDTIHQTSTLHALIDGVYDGDTTIGTLKNQGDLGIGTVNALDGELVVLNGKAWHIRSDGKAYELKNSDKTPFACVTKFESDISFKIPDNPANYTGRNKMDYARVKESIDAMTSKNLPYAIKITGEFAYVKTRSVPKQKKPYPPLTEVTKNQPMFEFKNIRGTLIGYKLPSYLKGVNVAGYHLHFITEDRTAGGHVLDFIAYDAIVELDTCYGLNLKLPKQKAFSQANLNVSAKQIDAVEK